MNKDFFYYFFLSLWLLSLLSSVLRTQKKLKKIYFRCLLWFLSLSKEYYFLLENLLYFFYEIRLLRFVFYVWDADLGLGVLFWSLWFSKKLKNGMKYWFSACLSYWMSLKRNNASRIPFNFFHDSTPKDSNPIGTLLLILFYRCYPDILKWNYHVIFEWQTLKILS